MHGVPRTFITWAETFGLSIGVDRGPGRFGRSFLGQLVDAEQTVIAEQIATSERAAWKRAANLLREEVTERRQLVLWP